jgi:hypothetical protein
VSLSTTVHIPKRQRVQKGPFFFFFFFCFCSFRWTNEKTNAVFLLRRGLSKSSARSDGTCLLAARQIVSVGSVISRCRTWACSQSNRFARGAASSRRASRRSKRRPDTPRTGADTASSSSSRSASSSTRSLLDLRTTCMSQERRSDTSEFFIVFFFSSCSLVFFLFPSSSFYLSLFRATRLTSIMSSCSALIKRIIVC